MCFLGNATMPTLNQDFDSRESENQYGLNYNQQMFKSCLFFNIQNRKVSIHGEMKSLNQKWNLTYFDKVKISSRLGSNSVFKINSEEILAKACSPYPYEDDLVEEEVKLFKGYDSYEYCEKLLEFVQNETFYFVPNCKSIGSKDYCREL